MAVAKKLGGLARNKGKDLCTKLPEVVSIRNSSTVTESIHQCEKANVIIHRCGILLHAKAFAFDSEVNFGSCFFFFFFFVPNSGHEQQTICLLNCLIGEEKSF